MNGLAQPAGEMKLVRRDGVLGVVCSCWPREQTHTPALEDDAVELAHGFKAVMTCRLCGASNEVTFPNDDVDTRIDELARKAGADAVEPFTGDETP